MAGGAMETKGKGLVVITGGSAGVGRATALEFARRGYSIGLIARGADRLKEAEKEIVGLGGRAMGISADVANSNEVEDAAGKLEEGLGPIEIWVNNAMSTIFSP